MQPPKRQKGGIVAAPLQRRDLFYALMEGVGQRPSSFPSEESEVPFIRKEL